METQHLLVDQRSLGLRFLQIVSYSDILEFRAPLTTNSVDPTSTKTRQYLHRLDAHTELYLIGAILDNSSVYLYELCSMIRNTLDVSVSPPTVCRVLQRHGITRKKIRHVALQRCYALRGAFMAQVFMYNRHMFVWVDETGCDNRTHIRTWNMLFAV